VSDDGNKEPEESSSGPDGDGAGGDTQADPDKGERMELPSWNRSRSKRKANVKKEEQEDAFQRGVKKAGTQALSQPRNIIIGLVVLVGAIGLGVWLQGSNKAASAQATRELAAAVAAEHRGRVLENLAQLDPEQVEDPPDPLFESKESRDQAVLSALEDLESEGGDAVILAKLVRGARALRSGDYETATSEYNGFLAEAPADHPLHFLGVEGRGLALEGSGDLEGALAEFEKLAPNAGDFYRDQALYSRGRVLEGLGRPDEAVELYKQFFQEFPPDEAGMSAEKVRARLQELAPDALTDLAEAPGLEVRNDAAPPPGGQP
jgi:tetratricopeptide (TPR) repeat protein